MPAGKARAYHVGPRLRKAMAGNGKAAGPSPQREKAVKSADPGALESRFGPKIRIGSNGIFADAPSSRLAKGDEMLKLAFEAGH